MHMAEGGTKSMSHILNCICCKHVNQMLLLQVEGNLIKWQKWQIRTSFNYREGVVLHNVG